MAPGLHLEAQVPLPQHDEPPEVLRDARRFIRAREEMKNLLILHSGISRDLHRVIKTRLIDSGWIDDGDELYFLIRTDLEGIVSGRIDKESIREIVKRRRQEFEWSTKLKLPKVIHGLAKPVDDAPAKDTADQFFGIGVCPGV